MNRTDATTTARLLVDDAVAAAQAAAPDLDFEPVEDAARECYDAVGKLTDQIYLVIDQTAVAHESTSLTEMMDAVEAVWRDRGVRINRKAPTELFPGPSIFGELDDFNLEAGYIAETPTRPLSILLGVSTPCFDP